MIQSVVLFSGTLLAIAYAALFAGGHRLRRGHWLLSLLAAGTTATAAWAFLRAAGAGPPPFGWALAGTVAAVAAVAAAFERWNALGHLAFAATVASAGSFLAYTGYVLVAAHLGPWSLTFGLVLFVLQAGALVLLVAGTFENLDAVCRTRWLRRAGPVEIAGFTPKVSIHVPIHNEPPDLVRETLDALAALDYPDVEVLVIDNNTGDEALWRPVEAHCRALGPRFRFFHLDPWPGYKSGALNFALAETHPEAELVGIVDADYVVEPDYLRDLVGLFHDPAVAFVQTPQDYRDGSERGRFARALYLSYAFFFAVSMPSRNEYNGIIFAGTMGLIRRRALEGLGGWDEWCITEDAELSLRLLALGHTSFFVERTYGRGLMPLDYAGLKKQRYRWAFGGMQILRMHAGRLFGLRNGGLTAAQRASYVNGGLQWLNDPLTFAFSALLLLGGTALLFGGSLFVQPLVGAVLFVPPLFIVLAVMRFAWALRVRTRCGWGEAFDALTILMGLTWVVTLACVQGLTARQGVFLRTPKQGERPRLADAIRVVLWELGLGTACLVLAGALVAGPAFSVLSARGLAVFLILWQAYVYLAAVRSSLWSYAEGRARAADARRPVLETLGRTVGRFVTEPRLALGVGLACLALGALFAVAVRRAPPEERIYRANPRGDLIAAPTVLPVREVEAVGATLVRESDAARRGDVEASLALWASDGVIIDRNFTPDDASDDRTWSGTAGLRARYATEFAERRYRALRHLNPRVTVRGDTAVIVNDLDAVVADAGGVRRVGLARTDEWTLRRRGAGWEVVRLEVNRSPAGAPAPISTL